MTISDKQLSLSVLISLGNSSGSGFLFRDNKNIFLVTAKHVLFDDNNALRSKEIEITCQTIQNFDPFIFKTNLEIAEVKSHKIADVTIVNVGKLTPKEDAKDKTFNYSKGTKVLSRGQTKPIIAYKEDSLNFHEVSIASDIYIFGYPTSLGIETSVQFDSNKPLIRKGIVANVYNPMKTIILDCPVYGGNSGGPVVQVVHTDGKQILKLIGVVSQFIPFVQKWRNDRDKLVNKEYMNSGYSVATSLDHVIELMDSSATQSLPTVS